MTTTAPRFDDMIETVIERAGTSPSLRAVGWQQLVDLLARRGGDEGEVHAAYSALDRWRPDVPAERRTHSCAALVDRAVPERLFHHLVADEPAVASPVLVGARVPDDVLIASLPRLSGPARSLLRSRAEVSPSLRRALDAYGPADRALETDARSAPEVARLTDAAPAADDEEHRADVSRPVPIRTLVDRIDQHRRRHARAKPGVRSRSVEPTEEVRRFAFETDRAGRVVWTDAPGRGAVMGLAVFEAADEGGVTLETAERFARRLPLQRAELTLPAGSPLEGAWRVDALPVFARQDGRFGGYLGHARRGLVGEEPGHWALSRSDDFRQLVHELKTPLNAIIGFSELIGEELLGPANHGFSEQVADVRRSGLSVLATIEDVDLAARLDARQDVEDAGVADLTAVVAAHLARRPGAPLRSRLTEPRWVNVAPSTVRRLASRLIDGLSAAVSDGEILSLTVKGGKRPRLRIATPRVLADLPPHRLAALRVPGDVSTDDPLLGLEFALRLARRLAEQAGGALTADAREFTLSLPPMLQQGRERQS